MIILSLALLTAPAIAVAQSGERPYSCRLLDDEQRKCAFMKPEQCDRRVVERLTRECWRDGGRP